MKGVKKVTSYVIEVTDEELELIEDALIDYEDRTNDDKAMKLIDEVRVIRGKTKYSDELEEERRRWRD